ncbi:MAG TPA: CcdB family protein [Steroidobacteraceae bacterium]|jgi:toxin CcdB|nr:CcdB family protein [Steroidobacteraceae bacterium]
MPQFAVYRNQNPQTATVLPFLVDVQADLLEDLQTRAVIPLSNAPELTSFPLTYLTPAVTFEGHKYLLMTPQMTGIVRADLGSPVGSIADQQRTIFTAIDFLVRGF